MKFNGFLYAFALTCALGGCGEDSGFKPQPGFDGGTDGPLTEVPGSTCGAATQKRRTEGYWHVEECSKLTFDSNPPSSGNHYERAPGYGMYKEPLPRGFWVHTLEHGGIVISYNCPDGCDAEVKAAEAMLNALPFHSLCTANGVRSRRLIITPDPKLDTKWAASAWGHTLRATCFEANVFEDFYYEHVNKGPENLCNNTGNELRREDGTLNIKANCGE